MIPHFKGNTPFITTEQMMEVDRIMQEDYGISLIQMMEIAGLNLAILARDVFFNNELKEKKVLVVAGSGGNGGGALVAARRLSGWGANVSVLLSSAKSLKKETKQQFEIIRKMKIPVVEKIHKADLIIDGIIGYNISGDPKSKVAGMIESINASSIPVLSLDAPSGLDLTSGVPGKPSIKANATMAVGLPKIGLYKMKASKIIGDLYLADIGIPPNVYKSFNIDLSNLPEIFKQRTVVKINKLVVFS
jgi:NAD(P)H-hydrate epimerase